MARWLTWIKKRPQMVDPVFGKIVYYEGGRVWDGNAAVGDQPVSLLINAGPHGPTDRQRECFARLNGKLPEYRAAIESSVDGATGSDWSLVVVDFQTEEPAPTRIELTFEHEATLEMVTLVLDVDLQVSEVHTDAE